MELVDTHCHIHLADYGLDPDETIQGALAAGVSTLICVGTTLEDSREATDFVANRKNCWASIGLHPHEGKLYAGKDGALDEFAALAKRPKVVAIGECGLDYYYNHSPKAVQRDMFEFQLELAAKHNLPLIFHVREAFDDFLAITDQYRGLRGVVHSFSATVKELERILSHGFYVGLNGIMTFTKDENQLAAAKAVPLEKLVLETDAPFLTPVPFRGKICQPKHVRVTAEFLAKLRGETLTDLARATTRNAQALFNVKG